MFAIFAICFWPVVAIVLYRMLPLGPATLWTILGAQLLLPVGTVLKIPMVPQFDKTSIPNICAFLGCLFVARRTPKRFNSIGLTGVLIIAYLVGPFITSELNGDAIFAGDIVLPGVGIYDAISAVESALISLLPFFLGRLYLRESNDNVAILRVLVVSGLVYSVPMLFEIRFSPQLHYWIYGYYPTDFIQEMRDGGFRPMVFMGHGLLTAFFTMTATVAAAALWRTRVRPFGLPPAGVCSYLGVILVLCKTFGALLYALVLVPLVRLAKPRIQLRIAFILVLLALLYPMLRSFDVVPTRWILSAASSISVDRANSMRVRFDNEDLLLGRASQRLFFGWGRFGRSRVYTEWGQDISITDGRWVITFGQFGLFGFFAEFGLLFVSVMRAGTALRFANSANDRVYLAALALIVAVNVIDLLPNSGLIPWTWLLAGALLGRSEALLLRARERRVAQEGPPLKKSFGKMASSPDV